MLESAIVLDESKVILRKQQVAEESEFEMYYFKGDCAWCGEELAIFDLERKIYYLRNVIPNYIG